MKKTNYTKKAIIFVALAWGSVIGVTGFINGNQIPSEKTLAKIKPAIEQTVTPASSTSIPSETSEKCGTC